MIGRGARRHRRKDAPDLEITAFMNLMVVLVPFLLITAVFSRLAILELNLPSSTAPTDEIAQALNLEIVVRSDRIEVADRGTGLLRSLPSTGGNYDLKGLGEFLYGTVKARFPDASSATVLLEPDIAYDTVVQVMDTVRVHADNSGGRQVQTPLFPDISMGDAPAVDAPPGGRS
jgi:biopolymer transport protein ExbD